MGRGRKLGSKLPEATKNKISIAMLGHKVSDSTRKKIGRANKGRYVGRNLSQKTKDKMGIARTGKTGKFSGNWRGGVTSTNDTIRKSLEYEIWRKEIYKKDKWKCRMCGHKGKNIVAHHIKLFSEFPELRFSVDNGVVLCRRCHFNIHHHSK